jgi:hypothetical protein
MSDASPDEFWAGLADLGAALGQYHGYPRIDARRIEAAQRCATGWELTVIARDLDHAARLARASAETEHLIEPCTLYSAALTEAAAQIAAQDYASSPPSPPAHAGARAATAIGGRHVR